LQLNKCTENENKFYLKYSIGITHKQMRKLFLLKLIFPEDPARISSLENVENFKYGVLET
jgi:hypothetical protein